jgi:hypothetical protein
LDLSGVTSVTNVNVSGDRARLVTLDAAVDWQGGTVQNSGQITATDAIFTGINVLTSTVAAGSGAVLWNSASDPDGNLDGGTYTKGTNAHSAIEFGTSVTSNITIRNCDFTGFNGGNDANGATFKFLATTGSLNLNLVGCTVDASGFTVDDTAGITVTVVADPVSTEYTVTNTSGTPISGARVFLEASDGTGPLPFEAAVTIVQTTGTATVTHTSHNIPDGTQVVIRGAVQNGYNKVAVISVVNANSYTYSVDSGTVSPATGSPVASGVIIHDVTNGSGFISDSRTLGSSQPFKGFIRDSSGSPYHQAATVTGTVSNTAGFSAVIALLSDE